MRLLNTKSFYHSLNWILLWRLPIENHLKLSITEGRWNKVKCHTRNFIRHEFVKKTSMPNSIRTIRYIRYYTLSSPRPFQSILIIKSQYISTPRIINWCICFFSEKPLLMPIWCFFWFFDDGNYILINNPNWF